MRFFCCGGKNQVLQGEEPVIKQQPIPGTSLSVDAINVSLDAEPSEITPTPHPNPLHPSPIEVPELDTADTKSEASVSEAVLESGRQRFGFSSSTSEFPDLKSLLSAKPRKVATDIARIKEQILLNKSGLPSSAVITSSAQKSPPQTLSRPPIPPPISPRKPSLSPRKQAPVPTTPSVPAVKRASVSIAPRSSSNTRRNSSKNTSSPTISIKTPPPQSSRVSLSKSRPKSRPQSTSSSTVKKSSLRPNQAEKVVVLSREPRKSSVQSKSRSKSTPRHSSTPAKVVLDLSSTLDNELVENHKIRSQSRPKRAEKPTRNPSKSNLKHSSSTPTTTTVHLVSPSYSDRRILSSISSPRDPAPISVAAKLAAFAEAWEELRRRRKELIDTGGFSLDDSGLFEESPQKFLKGDDIGESIYFEPNTP
ncbi:hypothetical protein RCL1_001058 [Eukaryota sp. TZLM3-RCL]